MHGCEIRSKVNCFFSKTLSLCKSDAKPCKAVCVCVCIWSAPTCKGSKGQNKPKGLAENTAKGISSPTLYGAHLSIPKDIALALDFVGRMGGAVGQRRQTLQTRRLDINWNTSKSRRGCPYKMICAATLKVEEHSFVC